MSCITDNRSSMLETPDVPSVARVMRVQPRPNEQPAAGFSWADYEDVDDSGITADDADGEDDGWIVKGSRSRSSTCPLSSLLSSASLISHITGPSKPSQAPQTAPETLTKKQRQNLAKREAQKAAKEEAEAQRQATLAKHKRDLEKVRMVEQYSQGKKPGAGMKAVVDAKGHLVFE